MAKLGPGAYSTALSVIGVTRTELMAESGGQGEQQWKTLAQKGVLRGESGLERHHILGLAEWETEPFVSIR